VSLWIYNDEDTYREALQCIRVGLATYSTQNGRLNFATELFCAYHDKTPDGAKYNYLCVKLVLKEMMADQYEDLLLQRAKELKDLN
jgi:hypothetical protein